MDWLFENWAFVGLFILFVWAHTKMHGGHGHAGQPRRGRETGAADDQLASHDPTGMDPRAGNGSSRGGRGTSA